VSASRCGKWSRIRPDGARRGLRTGRDALRGNNLVVFPEVEISIFLLPSCARIVGYTHEGNAMFIRDVHAQHADTGVIFSTNTSQLANTHALRVHSSFFRDRIS